ncbi:MAG TPA: hypothetical protein VFV94_04895 [Polyangiaceae bacterium]|nr:hypothetical protein [Polyangiaceae bacterium]
MSTIRLLAPLVLVMSGAALAAGCSGDDPVTAAQHQITCNDICQRYADCFDDGYDVDACTDRCTDKVAGDDEKDGKLRACDACMDDNSCISGVFDCGVDCSTFLP